MAEQTQVLPVRHVLAAARVERGWSLREVAGRLGVSVAAVAYWESGERDPGLSRWQEYAALLGHEIVARPIGGDR